MDTSDKEIYFNSKGECNHCVSALKQLAHYEATKTQNNLNALVSEIKKHPGKEGFHAIVGISGGVDSSYLIHALREEKIKLLAVHVDAGWNSIEAVRNINSLVATLDIDLETVVVNWEEMKNLQLAYLKSGVMNQDVPQDHAFFSSLFKIAREYEIKYVLSGSNYSTESILPQSWGQNAMDGKQVRAINRKFGDSSLKLFPITTLKQLYLKSYVLRSYRVVAPLNSIDYKRHEAITVLKNEYSWKDYGGKHKESRFTDFFQEIYLPERHGIQKKRAHLSSLIINGEISRNDALRELNSTELTPLEKSNLEKYIATKLSITVEDLHEFYKLPYVDDRQFQNEAYLHFMLKSVLFIRNIKRFIFRRLRK
jgi:N-acetyl sugar amidotransferase